jgi:hypothetical protein
LIAGRWLFAFSLFTFAFLLFPRRWNEAAQRKEQSYASFFNVFLTLFLVVSLAVACSTQKTVTTRQVQYDPRTGEPITVEKETTTTTESSAEGGRVLSGTVKVLGEIIALPFRVVGILIHAIL